MEEVRIKYNKIFDSIGEAKITSKEMLSCQLPTNYTERDLLLNVRKIILERGVLSNEITKLNLYAEKEGISLKKMVDAGTTNISTTNIFIGGKL